MIGFPKLIDVDGYIIKPFAFIRDVPKDRQSSIPPQICGSQSRLQAQACRLYVKLSNQAGRINRSS